MELEAVDGRSTNYCDVCHEWAFIISGKTYYSIGVHLRMRKRFVRVEVRVMYRHEGGMGALIA